jgi:hypothetical protein
MLEELRAELLDELLEEMLDEDTLLEEELLEDE